ncbi:proline-rich protein 2-like [Vulpes lagopus]|uniref:proline-rich protein 2-like n=1 Tax=Vulpes lagopus TaxID=494514 RepID=UPI001BC9A60A|nr:proline-rich protein 2-like [Vulpes lagopus]
MAPPECGASTPPRECPPSARPRGPDRAAARTGPGSFLPTPRLPDRSLAGARRRLSAPPANSPRGRSPRVCNPPGPSPFLSSQPLPRGRGAPRPALWLPRGGLRPGSQRPEPPSPLPPAGPALLRGPAQPPHERVPGPRRPSHTRGPPAPALPVARPARQVARPRGRRPRGQGPTPEGPATKPGLTFPRRGPSSLRSPRRLRLLLIHPSRK